MNNEKQFKGFLFLLTAGAIFGTFGIFIRILGKELSSFQQIAFRNIIASLTAFILIYLKKSPVKSLKNANPFHLIAFSITFPIAVS